MGEKMTLDDARAVFKATSEGLHSVANACSTNYRDAMQRRAVEFDKALAAIDAHITQPAQAVDVGALAGRLRVASDEAYCDYVRQLNATECLGWESKVSRGKFDRIELDAHNRAHELLGRHRALSEAVAILTAALPKDSNGAEGV